MQPTTEFQNQQKFQSLGLDAKRLKLSNDPAYFCKGLYRNGVIKSRPILRKYNMFIYVIDFLTIKIPINDDDDYYDSTYIKTSQTIPTKYMFASFTHHLSTAFVLFNWHGTHRAAFD